jgi:hypothetical protein
MGMERGEGRADPNKPLPSNFSTKDPGFFRRKKIAVTCNGYTDPKDGTHKVAPGHQARTLVFSEDAHQTPRCPACQKAYRSAYRVNWASKKAKREF